MKGTCSSIIRQVSGIILLDVIVFLQAIRDYIAIAVAVVVIIRRVVFVTLAFVKVDKTTKLMIGNLGSVLITSV